MHAHWRTVDSAQIAASAKGRIGAIARRLSAGRTRLRRVIVEVILVFRFGFVELLKRYKFGYDGITPVCFCPFRSAGDPFLRATRQDRQQDTFHVVNGCYKVSIKRSSSV